MEAQDEVQAFVDQMMAVKRSAIFVRHYNFIDFEQHGVANPPDYFNMVRDPVEKVISWYYYHRSPYRVAMTLKYYPDTPPPDLDQLKMDYETCVLTG